MLDPKGPPLTTPSLACSILPGITRDSVIQLARKRGLEVHETQIPRASLYVADEVFFTGTAAEITPVRSIDRQVVGAGKRGPITTILQEDYFAAVNGRSDVPAGWLTPVARS